MTHSRLASLLFGACLLVAAPVCFAGTSLTLSSGKTVEILSITPSNSTAGGSGLALEYRTPTSLSDAATLRKEADELWDHLAGEAERGHYEQAVITAAGTAGAPAPARAFVYKKQGDSWRTLESRDATPRKALDAEFVKAFIERLDWLGVHGKFDSLLLYLADDFTQTLVYSDRHNKEPLVVDREQAVTLGRTAFAEMKDHKYRREILSITVSRDGQSAEVKSRENEEETIRGQHLATVADSTDLFTWDGEVMLVKRSISKVESIGRDL